MPDVLKATYADLKTVKTRGVCQIVLEMPIEGMADAFGLLGAPIPGNEVWVAVARLRPEAVKQIVQGTQEPLEADPPRQPRPLSQLAAMTCNEGRFWRFLAEKGDYQVKNADDAAQYVRLICGVKSRAEFDTNVHAAGKWRDLRAEYEAWKLDVAA